MNRLRTAYSVAVPVAIVTLAFLLYREYQTREIAVTGSRLDSIGLSLRNLQTLAEVVGDEHALELINGKPGGQYPSARDHFAWAIDAYRKKEFARARTHIHNTMWNLDLASQSVLMKLAREKRASKPDDDQARSDQPAVAPGHPQSAPPARQPAATTIGST